MSDFTRAPLVSALAYRDPRAALDWLERAFGFERMMVITDGEGQIAHSEMRHGDGQLMIGGEWMEDIASPASAAGKNTQTVHVHLSVDIDAHCARARAAGADILQAPETQFYGDRTYRARDPEGHIWTFGQTVTPFSVEESEKATGLKIEMFS